MAIRRISLNWNVNIGFLEGELHEASNPSIHGRLADSRAERRKLMVKDEIQRLKLENAPLAFFGRPGSGLASPHGQVLPGILQLCIIGENRPAAVMVAARFVCDPRSVLPSKRKPVHPEEPRSLRGASKDGRNAPRSHPPRPRPRRASTSGWRFRMLRLNLRQPAHHNPAIASART